MSPPRWLPEAALTHIFVPRSPSQASHDRCCAICYRTSMALDAVPYVGLGMMIWRARTGAKRRKALTRQP